MKKNIRKRPLEEVLEEAVEIGIEEGISPYKLEHISHSCRDETLKAGGTSEDFGKCFIKNVDDVLETIRNDDED